MKVQPTAVYLEPDAWVLALIAEGQPRFKRFLLDDETPPETRLREWLDSHRVVADQPLVLGLHASACYAAGLSTEGLALRGREAALRYRLEAKLPEDLERLTVKVVGLREQQALLVAAVTSVWRDAAQRLTGVGLDVGHVVPTAVMAAAHGGAGEGAVLLQTQADRVDLLVRNAEGGFTAWQHLPAEAEAIQDALKNGAAPVVATRGLIKRLRAALPGLPAGDDAVETVNGLHAATRFAAELLSEQADTPFDFMISAPRQDPRWLRWRPVAAAVLVLVWSGFGLSLLKAGQFQREAVHAQDELRSAYVARFPGQTPPSPLLPRLRSQRGVIADGGADDDFDALLRAVQTLTVLPAAGDYSVDSVSISATNFRLSGEADTLGTVDRLVQSITQARSAQARSGLNPPATQILPSGRLRFELSSSASQASINGLAGGRP